MRIRAPFLCARTYNKLSQLWASAAEDPLNKQQQRCGSKQADRVSDADGQATNRSRSNSVELFFIDDDVYFNIPFSGVR
jgi:hypothetical protein